MKHKRKIRNKKVVIEPCENNSKLPRMYFPSRADVVFSDLVDNADKEIEFNTIGEGKITKAFLKKADGTFVEIFNIENQCSEETMDRQSERIKQLVGEFPIVELNVCQWNPHGTIRSDENITKINPEDIEIRDTDRVVDGWLSHLDKISSYEQTIEFAAGGFTSNKDFIKNHGWPYRLFNDEAEPIVPVHFLSSDGYFKAQLERMQKSDNTVRDLLNFLNDQITDESNSYDRTKLLGFIIFLEEHFKVYIDRK